MQNRPYRIKHKISGLYYKPGRPNLSKYGKVYIGGNNALNTNKSLDYLCIEIPYRNRTLIRMLEFREYKGAISSTGVHYKIPKTEFEVEYFT